MTTTTLSTDYDRIAEAIRYLEANYRDQPSLDDLAAHLHLSPSHVQRLFRRWAGISPKRFDQYLTVEHAKQALADSRSVLDSTYDAGLSSPGRLHDLFVAVEAVTPGEYKQGGAGLCIEYGFHATPFGECLLAATDRGVCALLFVDDERSTTLADLRSDWPAAELIENPSVTASYVDTIFPAESNTGQRQVTLLLKGTNFQLKVWEALLRIPAGGVSTYGDVARAIDKPGSARAVGSAVGANHIAYVIPCHRVIRSSGQLSDYRWGQTRKRAILGWEAAQGIRPE